MIWLSFLKNQVLLFKFSLFKLENVISRKVFAPEMTCWSWRGGPKCLSSQLPLCLDSTEASKLGQDRPELWALALFQDDGGRGSCLPGTFATFGLATKPSWPWLCLSSQGLRLQAGSRAPPHLTGLFIACLVDWFCFALCFATLPRLAWNFWPQGVTPSQPPD